MRLKKRTLLAKNAELGSVRVFGGSQYSVPVTATESLRALMLRGEPFEGSYRAQIKYNGPLKAPVAAGVVIGSVEVSDPQGNVIATSDVKTVQSVDKGPIYRRALDAALFLVNML